MNSTTYTYSKANLNAIATRALIDEEFKAGILNGERFQKLQEYPLPESVQREVLDLDAGDISQFIVGLHGIIRSSK